MSLSPTGARAVWRQAEVYTDGLSAFRRFADAGRAHTVIQGEADARPPKNAVRAGSTSCSPTSSDPSAAATTPSVRPNYARRYLGEAAYRFQSPLSPARDAAASASCDDRLRPCAEPLLRKRPFPGLRFGANQEKLRTERKCSGSDRKDWAEDPRIYQGTVSGLLQFTNKSSPLTQNLGSGPSVRTR